MVENIKKELAKVVIGHSELIDAMLIALFSGGHILIEGSPGVAKTTAVNALSKIFNFNFKRVQFTPDLLPLDIIGNEVYSPKSEAFSIKHGPVFTNFLLADEINRASPKVQSALLEAMAEKQVTIGESSFKLSNPFIVLATSNPSDSEGTYTLPQALTDRFMLKVEVSYNSFDEELEIIERAANNQFEEPQAIANLESFSKIKDEIAQVAISKELKHYILEIVTASREPQKYNLEHLKEYIKSGISPRGSIDLYKATKAFAYLNGKDYATPLDVAKASYLALPHRVDLSYKASVDNISQKEIIKQILEATKIP